MYRKMLVPLNVSELAAVSLPYAVEVAARLDIDVILLHVATSQERGAASRLQGDIEYKAEIIRRQSEEAKEKIGIGPGSRPVQVQGVLAIGSPAEEILRAVSESDVDLILMATHSRSGIRQLIMGSVTKKVLRMSNVPVWLIRPGAPEEIIYDQWPGRRIIVPLDGSELAEGVLPHVEALANQQGNEKVEIVLIRICGHPLPPAGGETVPVTSVEYMQLEMARREQSAKRYLTQIENQLIDKGLPARSEVLEGNAANQIIEYANAHPGNLIVMPTRAKSGLRRAVLGNTATNVLRKADSPVVIVRTS